MFRPVLCLALAGLLISCKGDPDYCQESYGAMTSQTFKGTIAICNAQPPDMAWYDATATISQHNSGEVVVHLKSDTTFLDTVLYFSNACVIYEATIAGIELKNALGEVRGQFSQGPDRVHFKFGYRHCQDNTAFEGYVR
ncbi:MAG: hypothetical protein IPN29_14945 [Saprospiraceae bacterium]|nr:hypothetical protein [Saprospiraceae bacterium]